MSTLGRRRFVDGARLGVALLLTAAAVVTALPRAARVQAAEPPSDSTVTVAGKDQFNDLRVTVAQTKDLINQVVEVRVAGAAPTVPSSGGFSYNYVQLMQCWGDAADGPRREQCQYGGLFGVDPSRAPNTAGRQLTQSGVVDLNETTRPGSNGVAVLPFESVTGPISTNAGANRFFDANTTNEVPNVRVRPDGNGAEFFEIQTAAQAPGLGCGGIVMATGSPRACWLVAVPRNNREVDGSVRDDSQSGRLQSSPLSESNWRQRLVVPLAFRPVGRACPLGVAERRTVGQEIFAEAILRWQPVLCAGNIGYGFSQVSDATARRQLLSTAPGMAFISRPLAPDDVDPSRPTVYGPVAVSGLTVAFNIESQSASNAPAEIKRREGQRLQGMNLTPRLVAKLLTQSYRLAVFPEVEYLGKNPVNLQRDPDFLEINPDYRGLRLDRPFDIITPLGQSDSFAQLWRWVTADAEARDFLAGKPDPFGMVLNPNYLATELPREDFPKSDPTCRPGTTGNPSTPPKCTLDEHPYAADLSAAARAASRGDVLFQVFDTTAQPPRYRRDPPLPSGARAVLVLADAASADRFGLQTAKLRNASGVFVAPDDKGFLAGAAAAKPTTAAPDVLGLDASAKGDAVYPLTTITYAATAPAALEPAAGRDYANLLRYAAGDGQRPGVDVGQLPAGYAPLPEAFRARTRVVADVIERTAGKAVASEEEGQPGAAPAATASPGSAAAPPSQGGAAPTPTARAATSVPPTPRSTTAQIPSGGGNALSGAPPTAVPAQADEAEAQVGALPGEALGAAPPASLGVVATAAPPAGNGAVDTRPVAMTAATPTGPARWVLLAALVLGAAALAVGPVGRRVRRSTQQP